ncbi:uncharacterized protein LOC124112154 [Haliotis rufescens]|uniref:uncharacterized protein LOC124112154 n=1 Tax=Haliotis rufescens TaxID=6454 RepID=UPI00201F904C|nr:uncharacterized protein LOC124112154 [Haliotis rufescens]
MMTLSFLMCIFSAKLMGMQVAADPGVACAGCTTDYMPAAGNECADLKKYLNCLETAAGPKDGCTLLKDDAKKIKASTCTTDFAPPCTCLKEFWGRDPTVDKECGSLKNYTECLNKAADAACDTGPKASVIVVSVKGRSDSKCSSGASSLGLYSAIASFLPFVITAFRL